MSAMATALFHPFPAEELEVYAEEAEVIGRAFGFENNVPSLHSSRWFFSRHSDGASLTISTSPPAWAAHLAVARDALMQRGEAMA